ncbi:MAG: hypothetical protein GTO02_21040, partial [Candidatus Dadabacteria bacterium]|nr:hypothetical protein [Candidatus Dadabacteria bacterium]NIQ16776.1 hypothetical protein [Candidatus Dadabacteria bacterium]
GIKIETGLDTNLNGILDSDEVVNEYFVCDGIPGAEGPQGEEGEEGTDGLISLIALDVEPKGSNCPEGGVRVSTGLDVNRNGILDPSEVTETTYLCNGQDGEDGEDGDSDNSISCSLVSGDSSNMGTGLINFALLLLIPVICFSARKRKHQFK